MAMVKRKRWIWPGWPRSVRAQLTLWYVAVFATLILLLGAAFYFGLRANLSSGFDGALAERTAQIASGVSEHDGRITLVDVTGQLPGLSAGPHDIDRDNDNSPATPGEHREAYGSLDAAHAETGTLVRILDGQGQTLYVSPAFGALVVPGVSVAQPQRGASWHGTVATHDGQSVRLYSAPLLHDGHVYGVVQVGQSLAPLNRTFGSIALAWFLLTPFALALSAVGGYWLAARAFRPIDRLTSTARRIEASGLHERVPVPRTGDEVQRLALTFNEMIERLEDAFARQRRFVSDASHELRAPVAAIASMTEVALDGPPSSEQYEAALRDVNAEAQRLGTLVGDLLALARTDEGRASLERAPVRLDELAEGAAAVMAPLAEERGVALDVRAERAVITLGDESRLIQAVMNLLDNALTYTPQGGVVTLTVAASEGAAVVTVSDTGIGIAPEHLPHIFERFYRADAARTRHMGGSGLGLAIVDRVIRAHEGSVDVRSEVGRGTTFTIRLPLAPDASDAAA